jgi:hypothetical protein
MVQEIGWWMRSLSQWQWAGGAALVVLALGAAAVPWYGGRALHAELRALAVAHADGDFRIARLEHRPGWLYSSGSMDLEWRSHCADASDAAGPVVVRVEYAARHMPDRHSLTRMEWTAAATERTGALGDWLRAGTLSGSGSAGYDGTLRTDMRLPEMQFKSGGNTLQVAPSSGSLVVGGAAVTLGWNLPRMQLRERGQSWQAEQLALKFDALNNTLGTGTLALDIGHLQGRSFTAKGVHFSTETQGESDRLNTRVTQSLKELKAAGLTVADVRLQAEVNQLHAPSLQTVRQLFGDTCGLRKATDTEREQMRTAVQALLVAGLSVGISKLEARTQDGSLDADLVFTLAQAPAKTLQLAEQLSSKGQIRIQGGLMPPDQKEFALSSGYAVALPQGVKSGFEYRSGVLTFNDKTMDSALVQLVLQKMDTWLKAFFAGEDMSLPPEEEPAVAPSEAPGPAV